MTRKTYHVVPHPDGGWSVKRGGATRSLKHFENKEAAIVWGREVSRKQHTEFVIHKRDGTVQVKDSYDDDLLPLAGRR